METEKEMGKELGKFSRGPCEIRKENPQIKWEKAT